MRYVTSRARTPLSIIVALTTLLIACAPAPPAAPSKPAAPAATTAPAAPTAAPAAAKPIEAPAKPAVAVPTAVAAKPTTAPVVAAPAKPAGEPTTWTIAVQGEAECFDVAICSNGILPNSIRRPMFEPLLQIEGEKLDYIPKLAESWKQIDDTTWDFFLRKNVKFHNGDPFTAEDVLYSYQLYSVDSAPNRTYTRIIESVTAPDPFTVRVKLNTPSTEFLQNTTSMSIMSKAYREKVGSDGYNKAPVGTGPYKFVEYKAGVHLVMEVDPSYWGGKATPDRLVMRPITDPATRVAELKTGGVDIIAAPPLTQLDQLNQGNTEVAALNGAVTIMYFFKTKEKPFDDKRVRQAINYAVDRQSIFKDVLQGQGTLLHGPWASPAWPGYDPNLQPYPYDPAKAKQLLAEAGYANGFETTLNLTNGAQLKDREIAEAIAGQLGEVGIKVRLIPTDPAKLNDIWKAGTFDGILQGRWAAPADPGTMINYSFDQANSQAVDPKMKELVKGIQSTFDNEKRLALLRELGTYANDYAPWLFMHAQNEFYAKRRGNPWTPVPVYSFGSVLWLQLPSR